MASSKQGSKQHSKGAGKPKPKGKGNTSTQLAAVVGRPAPPFGADQATTPRSLAAVLLWQGGMTDEAVLAAVGQRFAGLVAPSGKVWALRDVVRVRQRLNSGRIARFGKAVPPVVRVQG